ncbi:MAG: DUF2357 domain-containing protein, partial [Bacteroidales bacterium]|nr:DUF2357 domain-containing protein [Bacteroidales bacterium]
LGGEKLISSYRWSEGVEHVLFVHDNAEREIAKDIADEAVFFEQADYSVWVDFKKKASKAWFDSPRKDVNDRFSWKESKQLLAGYLNYGNEIGRADMPICYTLDGVQKRFVFSYDVISAKLDYHHDWKIILQDIEAEWHCHKLLFRRHLPDHHTTRRHGLLRPIYTRQRNTRPVFCDRYPYIDKSQRSGGRQTAHYFRP